MMEYLSVPTYKFFSHLFQNHPITLNFKMFQKFHYRRVIDEKYKHGKQNSSSQCHFVNTEPMT